MLQNPSSREVGSKNSGGTQLLYGNNPFKKNSNVLRSPVLTVSKSAETESMKIDQFNEDSGSHHNYYDEWKRETMARKSLEKAVGELQKKLDNLSAELAKRQISPLKLNVIVHNIEYETDEAELAKETEWIRIKSKSKKRKLNVSLTPPQLKNADNETAKQ